MTSKPNIPALPPDPRRRDRPVTPRSPNRPRHATRRQQRRRQRARCSLAIYDVENIMWPVRHHVEPLRLASTTLLDATIAPGMTFGRASAPPSVLRPLIGLLPDFLPPFPARGQDAADRVLLDWLRGSLGRICADELLIISGDGAFAAAASQAAAIGITVRVAALRGHISTTLSNAADRVHEFEYDADCRLHAVST